MSGPERVLWAPAKLTASLAVTGTRPDGYHLLDAEMVAVDLADQLVIDPSGSGLSVEGVGGVDAAGLSTGPQNLVRRALDAVGRTAGVHLVKRIPMGGGLGGGSTDAAAVLRWAGCGDPAVAATLGADVPFCLLGGRARVRGVGEVVEPLAFELRDFTLLLPPIAVDTAAVYRAFDDLGGSAGADGGSRNDLVEAALVVAPSLAGWRDALAEATGRPPRLAGSGSTWFVDGTPESCGLAGVPGLTVGGEQATLIGAQSVPSGWDGPTGDGGPGGAR